MGQSNSKSPRWLQAAGALLVLVLVYFGQRYGLLDSKPTPGDPGSPGVTRPTAPETTAQLPRSTSAPAPIPSPPTSNPKATPTLPEAPKPTLRDGGIPKLFADGKSDVWVEADATVEKLLADDIDGSRHQKFIARIGRDLTVLFAHNIDVAPRVPLQPGDVIAFRGEYVWKDKGGTIHWTHKSSDPRKRGGWIKFLSKTYE